MIASLLERGGSEAVTSLEWMIAAGSTLSLVQYEVGTGMVANKAR